MEKLLVFYGALSSSSSHEPQHQVMSHMEKLRWKVNSDIYAQKCFILNYPLCSSETGVFPTAFPRGTANTDGSRAWVKGLATKAGSGIWWRSEFRGAISWVGCGDTIIWEQPTPTWGMFWPPALTALMGTGAWATTPCSQFRHYSAFATIKA